jgi:hypothetical protein
MLLQSHDWGFCTLEICLQQYDPAGSVRHSCLLIAGCNSGCKVKATYTFWKAEVVYRYDNLHEFIRLHRIGRKQATAGPNSTVRPGQEPAAVLGTMPYAEGKRGLATQRAILTLLHEACGFYIVAENLALAGQDEETSAHHKQYKPEQVHFPRPKSSAIARLSSTASAV